MDGQNTIVIDKFHAEVGCKNGLIADQMHRECPTETRAPAPTAPR